MRRLSCLGRCKRTLLPIRSSSAQLEARAAQATDRHAAHRVELIGRLGEALGLGADWAVTSVKAADGIAHAHLDFETGMKVSRRDFMFDPAADRAIADALADAGKASEQ